jgi:hypothetical protein
MTVVLLAWLFGCGGDGPPAGPPAAGPVSAVATAPVSPGGERDAAAVDAAAVDAAAVDAAGARTAADLATPVRAVELVLDRGHFEDDEWVSEPVGADRLVRPAPPRAGAGGAHPDGAASADTPRTLARVPIRLPVGDAVARIARAGCGPVDVPYHVGASGTVVLPYPACAAPDAPLVPGTPTRLARRELAWEDVARMQRLGLFPDIPPAPPGEEDGPLRYVTLEEARGICAWLGGRLPTRCEWDEARAGATGDAVQDAGRPRLGSAPVGPTARVLAGAAPRRTANGHEDLEGNVEEWLADGNVAGGSFVSLPDEVGTVRAVPANARAETIGARCAWDPAPP